MRNKIITGLCLYLAVIGQVQAQKQLIDSNAYKKWTSIGSGGVITDQGGYVIYDTKIGESLDRTIIQSTKNQYKFEIGSINCYDIKVTSDERVAIFRKGKDSISILKLGTTDIDYISHVSDFRVLGEPGRENLFYEPVGENKLIIRNLRTGNEQSFASVKNYLFNEAGSDLILVREKRTGSTTSNSVEWLNLANGYSMIVWTDNDSNLSISNILLDRKNSQLAFVVNDNSTGRVKFSVCYYKKGTDKVQTLFQSSNLENGSELVGMQKFSSDGNNIFLVLKKADNRETSNAIRKTVPLTVWSYRDSSLQSYQRTNQPVSWNPKTLLAFLNVNNHKVVKLTNTEESIGLASLDNSVGLVFTARGAYSDVSGDELDLYPSLAKAVSLISTNSGERKRLTDLGERSTWHSRNISPNGKYIIYYDGRRHNYFSYEIITGITRNITGQIDSKWTWLEIDKIDSTGYIYGIVGWFANDSALLIHDQYDIWKIDPSGKVPPTNLTNGYGRRNKIFFDPIKNESNSTFSEGDRLFLSAFNTENKQNGFYSIILGNKRDPRFLSMGNYFYYSPYATGRLFEHVLNFCPVKARNSNLWLVVRMKSTESPNYFTTTDFKSFEPISGLYPERSYNWVSTELHQFKTATGKGIKGILYKPENFDAKKKYPVIIHYYEIKSDRLNIYTHPEASWGDLNLAWFISHGYLVFEPDIHYRPGEIGKCALESVTAAYNHLAKMRFVNNRKIGIQGHSFGGIQTNYIVTHSNLFAAACSSAGVADWVSIYGSLVGPGSGLPGGNSLENFYEDGQPRVGETLWHRPDLYIENSPIFRANKVSTPLLLNHTTQDDLCLFSNILEFFIALRRLEKKVWLLEYAEGHHVLSGKCSDDFSIRMAQFFDHYLKDAPAPKWMTRGIPYKMKGIEDGLELEPAGVSPGPSPFSATEKSKIITRSLSKIK